jgi:hypothetical protein
MARTTLAGIERFFSLRGITLRTGIFTGAGLSVTLVAWVVIANRVPILEPFALARNVAAVAALLMLMTIPVTRFLKSPRALFVSGVCAWGILTLTYMVLEMFFWRLESRMGPLQLFMLGAVAYGLLSVFSWVVTMISIARRQPAIAVRRRTSPPR